MEAVLASLPAPPHHRVAAQASVLDVLGHDVAHTAHRAHRPILFPKPDKLCAEQVAVILVAVDELASLVGLNALPIGHAVFLGLPPHLLDRSASGDDDIGLGLHLARRRVTEDDVRVHQQLGADIALGQRLAARLVRVEPEVHQAITVHAGVAQALAVERLQLAPLNDPLDCLLIDLARAFAFLVREKRPNLHADIIRDNHRLKVGQHAPQKVERHRRDGLDLQAVPLVTQIEPLVLLDLLVKAEPPLEATALRIFVLYRPRGIALLSHSAPPAPLRLRRRKRCCRFR